MFKKWIIYLTFFYSIYSYVTFFSWYLGDQQMIIEDSLYLSLHASISLFIFTILIHVFYHSNDDDAAQVISFPPIIFLFSMNSGFFVSTVNMYHFQFYSVPKYFDFLRNTEIGLIIIIFAILIISSALKNFKEKSEDPMPTTSSSLIISDGIYNFSRNPMYLGLCLLQVGIGMALSFTHIIMFTLLTIVIYRYGVIDKEELYLEEKFGDKYISYKNKTRRWL